MENSRSERFPAVIQSIFAILLPIGHRETMDSFLWGRNVRVWQTFSVKKKKGEQQTQLETWAIGIWLGCGMKKKVERKSYFGKGRKPLFRLCQFDLISASSSSSLQSPFILLSLWGRLFVHKAKFWGVGNRDNDVLWVNQRWWGRME